MKIWIFLSALTLAWIVSFSAQAQPTMTLTQRKLTALMAARVVINETSFAVQCVPWERRRNCINDLGAILQRSEHMAQRTGLSMHDEIRRHSPRATGRCEELLRTRSVDDVPRRCLRAPDGNVRWTQYLNLELTAPGPWTVIYPTLPWSSRRSRWERTLRDAERWLERPWYPCSSPPETWGGRMDTIGPGLTPVSCGPSRNTFVIRTGRRGPAVLPRSTPGTVPASVARGDVG